MFADEAGAKTWLPANEAGVMGGPEPPANARTLFEKKKLAKLIVMKTMHVREKAESKARKAAEGEAAGAGF